MDFNEYQELAQRTAVYPREVAETYTMIGVATEAGEALELHKKELRDGQPRTMQIFDELGDVLWYVALVCYEQGWSMNDLAEYNLEKLRKRQEDGTLKDR